MINEEQSSHDDGADEILAVGVDLDDTLLKCGTYFRQSRKEFLDLMAAYGFKIKDQEHAAAVEADFRRLESEAQHKDDYAIGIQRNVLEDFALEQNIAIDNAFLIRLREIVDNLRDGPREAFEDTLDGIAALAGIDVLKLLITMGPQGHQRSKIHMAKEIAGKVWCFPEEEEHVVPDKQSGDYSRVLRQHNEKREHDILPRNFVMVGDSRKSDILPVLAIGGHAILIERPGAASSLKNAWGWADVSPDAYVTAVDLTHAAQIISEAIERKCGLKKAAAIVADRRAMAEPATMPTPTTLPTTAPLTPPNNTPPAPP